MRTNRRNNGSPLISHSEYQVNKLLENYMRENRGRDYRNWRLRDVPFEVVWNEFSRSNHKLDVPENGYVCNVFIP